MLQILVDVLLLTSAIHLQPPHVAAPYQLVAVKVTGAKRYTADDVVRLSGLVVGKPVSVQDLQPAAERLGASGLFKKLQYRYTTAGRDMTVIFEFEESEWTVPVLFDNLVWFRDDEVLAAVRRDVPSFDGTAPPTEGAPDLIVRSLQKLLESRRIPGRIEFLPQGDLKTGSVRQYLFSVRAPSPRVCTVSVAGASPDAQRALLEAATGVVGSDYSRFYFTSMAQGTLLDVYRRRGHWRASFGQPSVVMAAANCSGVSVTLPVTEGTSYAWERAQWSGNVALSASDLDSLLGMKPGEVADASRIDAGLLRISKAYGKRGHIFATTRPTPRLDDASKRAVFEMALSEGPQFRMGTLQFMGISDADAGKLKGKWKLATGEVFDRSYPDLFVVKEVSAVRRAGEKPAELQMEVDTHNLVVNIRLVFK